MTQPRSSMYSGIDVRPLHGPPPPLQSWNQNAKRHNYKHPYRKAYESLPDGPGPLAVACIAIGAVLTDAAIHSSIATAVGVMAVAFSALAMLVTGDRSQKSLWWTTGLILAAASNLVLRTADLVVVPTLIALCGLFAVGAHRVLRPRAAPALGKLDDLFQDPFFVPSWLTKSIPKLPTGTGAPKAAYLRGAIMMLVVAVPVTALLASGDAAFASIFSGSDIQVPSILGHITVTLLAALLIGSVALGATRPEPEADTMTTVKKPHSIEAIMVISGISAVLGLWCALQFSIAIGGVERFLATDDLTAADYAREGFFQLVAVAAIALGTLLIAQPHLLGVSGRTLRWLRTVTVILIGEVGTLIAVALTRMNLYTDAFGLTSLRLSVAYFLLCLGPVFLFVGYRILANNPANRVSTTWTLLQLGVVAVVVFGWLNPHQRIAETNLTKDVDVVDLDNRYLVEDLSIDALPVVAENQDRFSPEDLSEICEKVEPSDGFFGWNASTSAAQDACIEYRFR